MNGTRDVLLIAKRELRERARSTAFLATTAMIVLIVVAMILGPPLLSDTLNRLDVRLVGTGQEVVGEALQATGRQVGMTVRVTSSDLKAAVLALDSGQVDVVVESATTLVWKSLPNEGWATLLNEALTDVAVQRRAAEMGLTLDQVQAMVAPVQPRVRYLEPPVAGLEGRRVAAMVGMVVLFMAISMFGNFVLTGVVEDKASRVVEVLLSRVPPHRLLAGKILGIGTLGAGQLALVAAAAMLAMRFAPAAGPVLPSIPSSMVTWTMVWFVLGYAFYSSAYAAAGALASRSEDAQSAVGPLIAVMIAGYLFTFTVVQQDPGGVLSVGASYVPITAPLIMPMRLAVGAASAWEGALAAGVMTLATYGLIRASGRVYRGAVLRVGARVRWADAWRGGGAAPPRRPGSTGARPRVLPPSEPRSPRPTRP